MNIILFSIGFLLTVYIALYILYLVTLQITESKTARIRFLCLLFQNFKVDLQKIPHKYQLGIGKFQNIGITYYWLWNGTPHLYINYMVEGKELIIGEYQEEGYGECIVE